MRMEEKALMLKLDWKGGDFLFYSLGIGLIDFLAGV